MFSTITILVFLATLLGIIVHWFAYPASSECRQGGAMSGLIHVFTLLLIEQRSSLLGALKKLCYLLAIVCFVVLALTGFYPVLVRGEHLSGYLLMIHATFAPIFAICLAVLGITWAGANRFANGDCPLLQRLIRQCTSLAVPQPEQGPCRCTETAQKVAFWAIVVLSLPLILSIVLSMLPLFGTHGQELAMAAHRWSALGFGVMVLIHTYLAVRIRIVQ
jgi:cytochrome b subunit of formate dehydrogenase